MLMYNYVNTALKSCPDQIDLGHSGNRQKQILNVAC